MSSAYGPSGLRPLVVGPQRSLSTRLLDREGVLRRLDWVLLAAVALLLVVGSLLVWSATARRTDLTGGDSTAYLERHLTNTGIGLVLAVLVVLLSHRLLRLWTPVLYLGAVAGLVAVLSPLGTTINGSHSWIVLPGGFSLQPSELAKVAMVLGMALVLGANPAGPRDRHVLGALAVAAVPAALVVLQPDLGTVMVMAAIVFGMLGIACAPKRWLFGLVAFAAVGAYLAIRLRVLEAYQVNRFAAFANPALDPLGVGYNTQQARIAIGSGGLWGKGLFQGSQTSGQFVPEQQTDFIFTVAGEELGLVGAGAIVLLLGFVLWRALRTAIHAEDAFGRLLAAGITCWFTFQVFENIGMTLGIMPVTGLPLPFVSYGGSAMFANLVAVGLLLNVRLRRVD